MRALHRIRFGLKTLAAIVFLVAIVCAFPARSVISAMKQSSVVEKLQAAGARVGGENAKYHTASLLDSVYEAIGIPTPEHKYDLEFSNQTNVDSELLSIGLGLRGLCFLTIDNSSFADLTSSDVVEMIVSESKSDLRYVDFANSDVSAADLKKLLKLPSLQTIYVCYCNNVSREQLENLIADFKSQNVEIHIGKGMAR